MISFRPLSIVATSPLSMGGTQNYLEKYNLIANILSDTSNTHSNWIVFWCSSSKYKMILCVVAEPRSKSEPQQIVWYWTRIWLSYILILRVLICWFHFKPLYLVRFVFCCCVSVCCCCVSVLPVCTVRVSYFLRWSNLEIGLQITVKLIIKLKKDRLQSDYML